MRAWFGIAAVVALVAAPAWADGTTYVQGTPRQADEWFNEHNPPPKETKSVATDLLDVERDPLYFQWQCNVDGTVCGWVDGHKSTPPAVVMGDGWSQPSSISGIGSFGVSIAPPLKTRCAPGWTLVDVGVAPGGLVHKCAPVGDLRDPE